MNGIISLCVNTRSPNNLINDGKHLP